MAISQACVNGSCCVRMLSISELIDVGRVIKAPKRSFRRLHRPMRLSKIRESGASMTRFLFLSLPKQLHHPNLGEAGAAEAMCVLQVGPEGMENMGDPGPGSPFGGQDGFNFNSVGHTGLPLFQSDAEESDAGRLPASRKDTVL